MREVEEETGYIAEVAEKMKVKKCVMTSGIFL